MTRKLAELRACLVEQGAEDVVFSSTAFPLTNDNFGAFCHDVGVVDMCGSVSEAAVLLIDTAKFGEIDQLAFLNFFDL